MHPSFAKVPCFAGGRDSLAMEAVLKSSATWSGSMCTFAAAALFSRSKPANGEVTACLGQCVQAFICRCTIPGKGIFRYGLSGYLNAKLPGV